MKDRKLSNALGSREYGVFLGGVHTRESTHFIDKYFIDKKEDKIDEQITKIYSQVIQACFILMEESSVTVIGINKT